jgi:hypothetical protein
VKAHNVCLIFTATNASWLNRGELLCFARSHRTMSAKGVIHRTLTEIEG